MFRALLHRSFRRARALLIALASVLAVFQVLVVVAATYLEEQGGFTQMVALLPPFVQQALGGVFSSFASMVAFGYFHPVVVFVFVGVAIFVATEPAADVESGVVDLVLARPIRRAHIVTRSMVMLALTTAAMAGVMVLASWLSLLAMAPPDTNVRFGMLLRLASNLVAVAWTVGALALAAAAAAKRRATAGGGVAILVLALYLINFLADLLPNWRPYGPVSPFHYYQPIGIVTGLGTRWGTDVLLLITVAGALSALAFSAFSKRDV